ncbi:hypothetical protein E4U43_006796, partial [Claviceps pusilla]
GWTRNLMDTDKIYTEFFKGCHQNPSTCALSRPQDSSFNDIKRRFETWLHILEKTPATSIDPTGEVRVLSASDVRHYMGALFYVPISNFMNMAYQLNQAMNGDTRDLFEVAFQAFPPQHSKDGCLLPSNQPSGPNNVEASVPVLCGDGGDVSGKDAAWWRRYAKQLASQSSILGPHWANARFSCSSWPFRSNWPFKGPFSAPAARKDVKGKPVPGYPAAPNLYVSSRLDPVTPLVNAQLMQSKYPGSGLVIVDAVGHTAAAASGVNKCFSDAIEEYLETGLVPPKTKICQAECGPWQKWCPFMFGQTKRSDDHSSQVKWPRFPLGVVFD